ISSTFLWQQLVRDREANAPWQKLRSSWLLLLQLLILLALVLALARPFREVQTITTGRIVLLLDASASMKATDVAPNRFARAREIGLDMVDTLGTDDTMTVIRVSAVPEVLAAASRDKLVLRDAIRSAKPGDVSADWFAAMTLAAAGAVGVDELKVVIVTDGGLPDDLPPVPGDVRFVPVGNADSNLAISALATDSLPGRPSQLFARISNYGAVDTDVIVDIRLDGSDDLFWAYRYTVPAQNYIDIFEVELPAIFDSITARLTRPSSAAVSDYLDVDDEAYAVSDRSGAGRVLLVTADNIFLTQIFRSLPGVRLFELDPAENLPTGEFDLYVFDGMLPDTLPDGDLLLVNPPQDTDFFRLGGEIESSEPLIMHPDDARVRNLSVYAEAINLQKFRPLRGIEWGTVLAQKGVFPVVVAGEVENRQVAVLSFDASYPNTDWVLQPAWPILIAELTAWFSPPRLTDAPQSLSPGAPVTVRFLDNADEAIVTQPDGGRVTIHPSGSSAGVFADTLQPGLYRVDLRRGGDTFKSEQFAVNLFDALESRIAPQESVLIGKTTLSGDAREETGRREFWRWVAGIGLVILVAEWWMYHRSLRRIPRVTLAGLRSTQVTQRRRWRAWWDRRFGRTRRNRRLTRTR
ncbi:MAG: VWA domain-containing protein, partial [Anaerolineae bacterium]|nr:VWA domain-containing protein [Anaerolineae bacterium]